MNYSLSQESASSDDEAGFDIKPQNDMPSFPIKSLKKSRRRSLKKARSKSIKCKKEIFEDQSESEERSENDTVDDLYTL